MVPMALADSEHGPLLAARDVESAPGRAFVEALRASVAMAAVSSLRQSLDFLANVTILPGEELLVAKQEELWRERICPAIDEFIDGAMLSRPCGALVRGEVGAGGQCMHSPIFCDQPMRNHLPAQHSSDTRFIVNRDTSKAAALLSGFRKHFLRASKADRDRLRTERLGAVWEGEGCQPLQGVDMPERPELHDLARTLYDLAFRILRSRPQASDPLKRFQDALTLLQAVLCARAFSNTTTADQQGLHIQVASSRMASQTRCLICLREYSREVEDRQPCTSGGCGHVFCRGCLAVLLHPEPPAGIPTELMGMASSAFGSPSYMSRCPMCRAAAPASSSSFKHATLTDLYLVGAV